MSGLKHDAGPMPDMDRIRQAHSRIPWEWRMMEPYYQSPTEGCYICAMLAEIDRLQEALDHR